MFRVSYGTIQDIFRLSRDSRKDKMFTSLEFWVFVIVSAILIFLVTLLMIGVQKSRTKERLLLEERLKMIQEEADKNKNG